MSSNIMPDEKTVDAIKKVLIIVSITLAVLICIMIIVILVKRKISIASESEFEKILTENGCTVNDETYKYSSVSNLVSSAYLAKSSDGSFNYRYVKLYDQDFASQFFNLTKTTYEKLKTKNNIVSESFTDDTNKGEYCLVTKKIYVRIERVGDTMFEASGYPQYKKEMDDIFAKLGF